MPDHRHGKTVEAGGSTRHAKYVKQNDEWAIEAVVYGDGSRDARGRELKRGVFYASAKIRGRHENYHPVQFHSINFCTREGNEQSLPTIVVSKGRSDKRLRCLLQKRVITKCHHNSKQQKELISKTVRTFLMKHPGVAVVIGGPGMRDRSVEIKPYLQSGMGKVFMISTNGRCVHAAIVNAVGCLRNRNAAHVAKEKLQSDNTHFMNLKPLGLVTHKLDGFETRRPSKGMGRALSDKGNEAFRVLSQLKSGVWIVRLCQPKVVDHCVAINAKRGLIYDCSEEYRILLSHETLRMCGSNSAPNLHVAEVREVVDIKN